MTPENQYQQQFHTELTANILPFWIDHTVDPVNGGFYGALTNDLHIHNEEPRSAVLCARILWTYALAYRQLKDEACLKMAQHAYEALTRHFWDSEFGGVYWSVDQHGQPLVDRKHSYANAFSIYGLSEYYRATRAPRSLDLAQRTFRLLDQHARDPANQGFVEGCSRDWGALEDMRLSGKEPNCRKSMNTLLHLMEAYANLLRVWEDPLLRARLRELVQVFLDHVIDPETRHFRLYFDDQWRWSSFPSVISYGHDIEGSWLLVEAAEMLDDPALLAQVRQTGAEMAQAVYDEGRDGDALVYESGPHGMDDDRHWWVQAEAVVGFYNAYQITGQSHFAEAASRCWDYIQAHFIDREHGEWFKMVRREGAPDLSHYKTGPWECPYHNARMCFEMLRRLE